MQPNRTWASPMIPSGYLVGQLLAYSVSVVVSFWLIGVVICSAKVFLFAFLRPVGT